MFERETSSLDSAEEMLREEDMLAGRQEKKSDFVHQGDFGFPRPNFCWQDQAGVYVRDRNSYNLCMYKQVLFLRKK
jgi:hypothetical protein